MNKLEKKLIECLRLKSLKDDFVKSQIWDQATETREKERRCALEFYNIFNETSIDGFDWMTSIDGFDWMTYDLCIKDYCISKYGTDNTKGILKMIDRVEKLKQLGI